MADASVTAGERAGAFMGTCAADRHGGGAQMGWGADAEAVFWRGFRTLCGFCIRDYALYVRFIIIVSGKDSARS